MHCLFPKDKLRDRNLVLELSSTANDTVDDDCRMYGRQHSYVRFFPLVK